MRNSSNDGVICDFCNIELRSKFTYYSIDSRKIRVYSGRRPEIRSILLEKINDSFDCCESCCENIKDRILDNYLATNTSYCEFSGTKLTDNYIMYYLIVDEVAVDGSDVHVDKRHLEFAISDIEYTKFAVKKRPNDSQQKWSGQ